MSLFQNHFLHSEYPLLSQRKNIYLQSELDDNAGKKLSLYNKIKHINFLKDHVARESSMSDTGNVAPSRQLQVNIENTNCVAYNVCKHFANEERTQI